MFKAKYSNLTKDGDYYWRSINADSINEAARIAARWCKRGWMLLAVQQEMFNDN